MPFFVPRKRKPSVKSTWARIDKWLSKHLPNVQKSLNRGATKRQIKDFETLTRRVLPDDVKESLLIHNGQADVTTGVIFGLQLMPLDQMAGSWECVRPFEEDGSESSRVKSLPKGAVQRCENHPGWIPMTHDWSGSHIGIDTAQGITGNWGQVINFGRSEYTHVAISSSWRDFLADFMDELANENFNLEDTGDGTKEFVLADPKNSHFCDILPQFYKKRAPKTG